MQMFSNYSGTLVALDLANIDTDQIIPKQFLKTITREGLGMYLFDAWRYHDLGYPEKPAEQRQANDDFPLNQSPQATILLTQKNFGCGSSREHAVWSLLDYGIDVVIAPSFADIFYSNCIKNGLLPLIVDQNNIDKLFTLYRQQPKLSIYIRLVDNQFTIGHQTFDFTIDEANKQRLLLGLDDIGITLESSQIIAEFENNHQRKYPWLFCKIS